MIEYTLEKFCDEFSHQKAAEILARSPSAVTYAIRTKRPIFIKVEMTPNPETGENEFKFSAYEMKTLGNIQK